MPTKAASAGSRKVEPRKRKRSPSDQRRKARRAIAAAVETTAEIQGTARKRQVDRLAGRAYPAARADTDLAILYDRYAEHRREAFATGLVPDGSDYRGRTWRVS